MGVIFCHSFMSILKWKRTSIYLNCCIFLALLYWILAFCKQNAISEKLSPLAIAILSKPAHVRFDFENLYIQRTLYRFQCFNRYPLLVKKELAKVIYYDKFEDGRLIIKQGKNLYWPLLFNSFMTEDSNI